MYNNYIYIFGDMSPCYERKKKRVAKRSHSPISFAHPYETLHTIDEYLFLYCFFDFSVHKKGKKIIVSSFTVREVSTDKWNVCFTKITSKNKHYPFLYFIFLSKCYVLVLFLPQCCCHAISMLYLPYKDIYFFFIYRTPSHICR